MKLIRQTLDIFFDIVNKNKSLRRFKAVITATDEFFFGTDKTVTLPHIADQIDIKRFMSFVIIALLPVLFACVFLWGYRVLLVILVSYSAGGLAEVAFAAARKKEIHEGFLVTGLIFPLILPPTVPLWVVAVGVIFGVIFGKEVFGGTGRNIFNPAIVGRIFLTIAFPSIMTTSWQEPFKGGLAGFSHFSTDAVTAATPLAVFKSERMIPSCLELLLGGSTGCIGETFRLGIILGGIFLIMVKVSNWRIPLAYLGSVLLFSYFGHHMFSDKFAPPLFQLLSGGLLFGAFFMATDPVTCPFTKGGKWIAGVMMGFFTVIIRGMSGYVEGVMFSILLMNTFSPLIDTLVLKTKYAK